MCFYGHIRAHTYLCEWVKGQHVRGVDVKRCTPSKTAPLATHRANAPIYTTLKLCHARCTNRSSVERQTEKERRASKSRSNSWTTRHVGIAIPPRVGQNKCFIGCDFRRTLSRRNFNLSSIQKKKEKINNSENRMEFTILRFQHAQHEKEEFSWFFGYLTSTGNPGIEINIRKNAKVRNYCIATAFCTSIYASSGIRYSQSAAIFLNK